VTSPLPPTNPPASSSPTSPPQPATMEPVGPAENRRRRRSNGAVEQPPGLPAPPLPPSRPRRRAKSSPAAGSDGSGPASPSPPPKTTTSDSSASTDGDGRDPLLGGPPATKGHKLLSPARTQEFVEDVLTTLGDEANLRERVLFVPVNPDQIPDLWLVDGDDKNTIAPPVARIIHRRLPAGADELGNPDLGDAIEALIALWFYARKQFRKLRDWRRVKRELDIPDDEGAPDAPAA
jgi:hypothetical protein